MARSRDDDLGQLQPNLNSRLDQDTALEYVNPALELDQPSDMMSDSQHPFKLPPPPKVKKSKGETIEKQQSQVITDSNLSDTSNGHTAGTYPVYYNSKNGNVMVTQEQATSKDSSGSRVIQTAIPFPQNAPQRWRDIERQRPLTAKRLRLLKIFGIIAAFVFFPLGIPAALYAFKAEKELHEGILKGNIDEAQKCAKRSERFIVFSWMFAILVAVLVFALVERSLLTDDDKNSVRNRVLPP